MTDAADRDLIERAIAEAGLRPYQAMVVRNTAAEWSVQAALGWIATMAEEASDGGNV